MGISKRSIHIKARSKRHHPIYVQKRQLPRQLTNGKLLWHIKTRKYSSYKGTIGKVVDNKINRKFKVDEPYTYITTDTTEFKYLEKDKSGNYQVKKLYLNPYLDMYNCEIISY